MTQDLRLRVLVCALVLGPSAALALDTVEPFGAGATDAELYVGGDGLGRRGGATMVSSFQLGYGLTDRVSFFVSGSATRDVVDEAAAGSLRAGACATVVDGERFDVDVFADVGTSEGKTGAATGVEVNLELGRFGLFATAREELDDPGEPEVAVGGLARVAEGHEVLLGYAPEGRALAAGYNVVLRDRIELINEVGCELGAGASVSLMTGVIVTVP